MRSTPRRLREEFGSVVGPGAYDHGIESGLDALLDDPLANIVDDDTLQPDFTVRRRGGTGRKRRRSQPKAKRDPGRPTIEDEARSVPFGGRMTPQTAATIKEAGLNPATAIALAARVLQDERYKSVIVELSAELRGKI